MRVLYVVPYVPLRGFAKPYGPRNASHAIIEAVTQHFRTHLAILSRERVDSEALYKAFPAVERVDILRPETRISTLKGQLRTVIRGWPRNLGGWLTRDSVRALKSASMSADLVHVDYFLLAEYVITLSQVRPVVWLLHDAFSLARHRAARAASRYGLRSSSMFLRTRFYTNMERDFIQRARKVFVLSPVDARYLRRRTGVNVRTITLPFWGYLQANRSFAMRDRNNILCVVPGGYRPVVVREVLEFLTCCEAVRRQWGMGELCITVWGPYAGEVKERYRGSMQCEFIDYVDDYWNFIGGYRVAVYPTRVGAGLHTKVLEMLGSKIAVVGFWEILAAFGGRSGQNYIQCRTFPELARSALMLTADSRVAAEVSEGGQRLVRKKFTLHNTVRDLAREYRDIIGRQGPRGHDYAMSSNSEI